jgi:D-alanine-D-alanine ligase
MKINPADLPTVLLYNLDRSWPPADVCEILNLADEMAAGLSAAGHSVQIICLEDDRIEQALSNCDPERQIVFNWCEEVPGIPRSSALVARTLEELGFTFTGADSKALLLSQDKPAVKERLAQGKIPTPNWQVFNRGDDLDWDCFPAIVKPTYEHYSCGITHEAVVHNSQELSKRVSYIAESFRQPVLIEDFIDGREFHVTVTGNGKLQVFPIAEMDFSLIEEELGRLCTYDSKFNPNSEDYNSIQLRLPAPLSKQEARTLEKIAVAAYRATDCRDYARLDIRERDSDFYVLDVNPNADISPDTSLALSAELAGFSHAQFGSLLVKLAALRHPSLYRKVKEQVQPGLPATLILG